MLNSKQESYMQGEKERTAKLGSIRKSSSKFERKLPKIAYGIQRLNYQSSKLLSKYLIKLCHTCVTIKSKQKNNKPPTSEGTRFHSKPPGPWNHHENAG